MERDVQLLSKIRSRYDFCIFYLQLFQVVLTSVYRNWITKKRRLVSVRESMIRIHQLHIYYHLCKNNVFRHFMGGYKVSRGFVQDLIITTPCSKRDCSSFFLVILVESLIAH